MSEEIVEVSQDNEVLARYIPSTVAWSSGLNFFSADDDFIQVGTWGYDAEVRLKPHIHNEVSRTIYWTQEVIFVRSGRLRANIFNKNEKQVSEIEMSAGDIIVLLGGGHGYDVLEEGTQVLEIKNGPYVGAELDRRRFK